MKEKTHWVKTTLYGDYTNPVDSNKPSKDCPTRTAHIITKARRLFVATKHAGSKPISKLISIIRSFEMNNDIRRRAAEKLN